MKTRFLQTLFLCFSCIFTFLGFGVSELYMSKRAEFWFDFKDILMIIVLIIVICTVLLTAFLCLIPDFLYKYLLAIIWSAGIALYIQGNFLPNNYGALNGEVIVWESYHIRGIINTCIWILIIGISIYFVKKKKEFFKKAACMISGILLATQLVTLGILAATGPRNLSDENILTEEGIFEVSAQNNVIVFVLDCFDSELFNELLQAESKEWVKQFDDFEFFHNTVGGATRTKYAIPYILTGQPYTEPVSYPQYLKDSFSASPLLKSLADNDLDVRIYAQDDYIDLSQSNTIKNIATVKITPSSRLGLTKDFLKLTAFRYAPHVLKKFFWLYSDDFESWKGEAGEYTPYAINDPVFYHQMLSDGLTINDLKGAFRFYHLMGAHPPYTMNSQCQKIDAEDGNETDQALGALKIVSEYIQLLKANGVYDHSTVVIMADHGCRNLEQNPLFLLKNRESHKPFQKNEFPLSYSNLQDIFTNILKGNVDSPQNYLDPSSERYFYTGSGNNNMLNVIEYATQDVAYNADAFYKTGRVFHGNTLAANSNKKYRLGTELLFTSEATANEYCVEGFSGNEGNLTWTVGNQSKMEFELEGKYKNLLLRLDCSTTHYSPQRLKIKANEQLVAEFIIEKRGVISAIIPGSCIKDNRLVLEFEHPDALSPASTGQATDSRILGISMYKISLENTTSPADNPYQALLTDNLEIDFSDSGNSSEYILDGWWNQEKEKRWTSDLARFFFAVSDDAPCQMTIKGKIFRESNVEVLANGELVEQFLWKENETSYSLQIPSNVIKEKGYLIITLKIHNAVSPMELNLSEDQRTLGIFVQSISISSLR